MTLTVHHLDDSRSQRILWLLEELGLPYEVVRHRRHPETRRAPAALREVHPLGKSPVLVDGGTAMVESGAIIEHVIDRHGNGRLRPAPGTESETLYRQWLHFSEGSLMLPLLMALIAVPNGGDRVKAYTAGETKALFGYVEDHLSKHSWFAGSALSGADIAMSFPLEAMHSRGALAPASAAWVGKIQERPAYLRALQRGGDYAFGPT